MNHRFKKFPDHEQVAGEGVLIQNVLYLFAQPVEGFTHTDPYQCILCKGRLRFAGAMAGEHATKMLSDRQQRMAKKRWLQTPFLDK